MICWARNEIFVFLLFCSARDLLRFFVILRNIEQNYWTKQGICWAMVFFAEQGIVLAEQGIGCWARFLFCPTFLLGSWTTKHHHGSITERETAHHPPLSQFVCSIQRGFTYVAARQQSTMVCEGSRKTFISDRYEKEWIFPWNYISAWNANKTNVLKFA